MPVLESRSAEDSLRSAPPWALWPSRMFLNLFSPGGRDGRLSIFMYHRVLPHADALFPDEGDAEAFDRHIEQLAGCFNIIPLFDAIRVSNRGSCRPAPRASPLTMVMPTMRKSRCRSCKNTACMQLFLWHPASWTAAACGTTR